MQQTMYTNSALAISLTAIKCQPETYMEGKTPLNICTAGCVLQNLSDPTGALTCQNITLAPGEVKAIDLKAVAFIVKQCPPRIPDCLSDKLFAGSFEFEADASTAGTANNTFIGDQDVRNTYFNDQEVYIQRTCGAYFTSPDGSTFTTYDCPNGYVYNASQATALRPTRVVCCVSVQIVSTLALHAYGCWHCCFVAVTLQPCNHLLLLELPKDARADVGYETADGNCTIIQICLYCTVSGCMRSHQMLQGSLPPLR